jgi:hypothetical protein
MIQMVPSMLTLLAIMAGPSPRDDRASIPVLTPQAVEAKMEKSFAKPGSPYWDGPAIVECGIHSVAVQKVTGPDGKPYENFVLHPKVNFTRFSIALSPKAQAAFKRLGIESLEDHFVGKQVKVQGRIGVTSLNLILSPTINFYELQVDSLDQFIEVKSVEKNNRK